MGRILRSVTATRREHGWRTPHFGPFIAATGSLEEKALEMMKEGAAGDMPRGAETILLAEDEESVRTLTQRVLESLGYTVLVARDGQEAVDTFAANQERVDLLILDGVMPRLSGQKAHQAIQALGRPVPALFITGYSPGWLGVSTDAGQGTWLLPKPFLPLDLARKVREALAK